MDYINKPQILKFIKAINSDEERVAFAKREGERNKQQSIKKNNPTRVQQRGISANPARMEAFVKILNKKFNQNEKAEIIKIMPFGFVRCCHSNSGILCEILGDDWEVVAGYNMTFCPCGKFSSAEIHSVVRHKPSGEYVDFTKDFDGLTHKAFYPLQSVLNIGAKDWFVNSDVLPYIVYKSYSHKCDGAWFDIDTDEEFIINVEDIPDGKKIDRNSSYILATEREEYNHLILYALFNPDEKITLNGLSEIDKIKKRGDYDTHFNQ